MLMLLLLLGRRQEAAAGRPLSHLLFLDVFIQPPQITHNTHAQPMLFRREREKKRKQQKIRPDPHHTLPFSLFSGLFNFSTKVCPAFAATDWTFVGFISFFSTKLHLTFLSLQTSHSQFSTQQNHNWVIVIL
ncbi:hypothetical protein O6H91_19G059600 [Diphasiastrum complanatum]|uniref:Uncharacterized protein n=1 Tax=Diphasiastrum complanatum TaxID=34168 RepID=A0ACC2AVP7_DIPCM|nr:hypothetical protein O6H91_19G059600 [Diphasiastrum complanatum]